MNVYTYSEERQNLSSVLDSAKSPLDIADIDTDISTKELVSFVRESRKA
jgi:hypothetical protein